MTEEAEDNARRLIDRSGYALWFMQQDDRVQGIVLDLMETAALSAPAEERSSSRDLPHTAGVALDDALLEAMCRAHDAEEAAQRGEPSPWDNLDDERLDDRLWLDERVECMRCAAEVLRAALASSTPAEESGTNLAEPVAWRVKGFADGWIYFNGEHVARGVAAQHGCLIEPLYAIPAPAADYETLAADLSSASAMLDRYDAPTLDDGDGGPLSIAGRIEALVYAKAVEALAAPAEARGSQPVAWRVKDFADGWILFHSEAEARHEAEGAGNLIQPLYVGGDH